jgi:xanthine dehydrogenase accessory factor
LWGFGLGCTGTVQVLVESLNPPNDPLTFIAQCWGDRTPGVLVSIIQAEDTATQLGAYLTLTSHSIRVLNETEPALIEAIISDAQIVLQDQHSVVKQYELATRQVKFLLEFIQPPIPLMIFGAGQDAVPIAEFAKALGWYVTVVDCRANPLSHERFATSDRVILTRRERLDCLAIQSETVAVIVTHNYYDDLETLRLLLPSSVRYIGLLGSKQRTKRLLQELQQDTTYTDIQLAKLYAPVGLDIGAETPAAIAMSIVAEIQAVLSDRSGNSLKYRHASIHETYPDRLTSPRGWGFEENGNA